MKLTSSAFSEGGAIPSHHTCDGENLSPPLSWTNVPPNTRAFALITQDPDAPAGTWTHWLVFNLPADLPGLPEGIPTDKVLENGAVQGFNSFRSVGYGGPCPPSGTHRYFFRLYALDGPLALTSSATASDLRQAIKGHILAEAELMGRYQR